MRVAIALRFVPVEEVARVYNEVQWRKNTVQLQQFFHYFEVSFFVKTGKNFLLCRPTLSAVFSAKRRKGQCEMNRGGRIGSGMPMIAYCVTFQEQIITLSHTMAS